MDADLIQATLNLLKFNLSLCLSQLLTVQVTPADISTLDSGFICYSSTPSLHACSCGGRLHACAGCESLKTRLAWLTFEHMIFKGTPALAPGCLDREIETVVE